METNKKTSKRTPPASVRFDKQVYDKLLESEGLKTPQQAVDFLIKWYDQVKFPISLEYPTLERNMVFKKAGGGVVGEIDLTTSHAPGSYQTNMLGQMEHIPYEDKSKGNSDAVKRLQKLKNK